RLLGTGSIGRSTTARPFQERGDREYALRHHLFRSPPGLAGIRPSFFQNEPLRLETIPRWGLAGWLFCLKAKCSPPVWNGLIGEARRVRSCSLRKALRSWCMVET